MIRYALTIFLSAFLLFQVQPLIAKYILPWFGGTPAVWTTCMLFFQLLLLVGYAYAHVTSWRLTPKGQAVLHSALLGVSLLVLPIIPSESWKPEGGDLPALRILMVLAVTVGIPYLMLSTTGPLLQKWFSRTNPGTSPYRLYSLSNVGSLLALISYPVVVEPALTRNNQAWTWSVGYGLFAALCGWCALRAFLFEDAETKAAIAGLPASSGTSTTNPSATSLEQDAPSFIEEVEQPGWGKVLLWLGLAAVPSVLLLATTNQMCQEVAVVPFLWVLPLSLYLISFIICFDNDIWYVRPVWGVLLALAAVAGCYSLYKGVELPFTLQIVSFSTLLFAACMTCHGELARSKPHVKYLTLFYLMVAAGGALGGLFVVVAAPYIFTKYWELHLGIVLAVVLTLVAYFVDRKSVLYQARPRWLCGMMFLFPVGLSVFLVLEAAGLKHYAINNWDRMTSVFSNSGSYDEFKSNLGELWSGLKDIPEDGIVEQTRTFYGVLTVEKSWDAHGEYYSLNHGRIQHGFQYLDEDKKDWRTSYYSSESGFGLAVDLHPNRLDSEGLNRPMHVGVIGLGTGSTAVYGRPGDRIRYYDINPEVKRIAYEHFSYCKDSQAEVTVVLGDARVKLEQERDRGNSQQFDVLAVDAFSSDAIPMHLLTKECFALYWEHLKEDGILAVHISNRYLDLSPVVRSLAEENGRFPLLIDFDNDFNDDALSASTWILITTNQEFLLSELVQEHVDDWELPYLIWTDDYGSLRQVLRSEDLSEDLMEIFGGDE